MSRPAPMNPSLPAPAQHVVTLPNSAWLQHKNVLHELYICQNKTLNEVKRIMEEEHGFPVMRPHDYEVALREVLGLRKNLTGQDWQAIKAHWDQRRDQGKKSNIVYNNIILDEKKALRSMSRKRKRSHLFRPMPGTPALPPGILIKTPPLSPIASMVTAVTPIDCRPDPGCNVPAASNRLVLARYSSPARSEGVIAFLEPSEVGLSRFQELRKECPFNVFIVRLQDLADSYHILDMIPVQCVQAPGPRLLGVNPSWELLARITFEMSNNKMIDWTAPDSSWFLNWFGLSADLRVLKAFFSITGPTVCAVYENLCNTVRELQRPAAANVLFEMLDTVRHNNPIVADALNFLEIAVRIGSSSDGMLRIARQAIERHSQVMDDAAVHGQLCLSSLIAASRRDTVMLRLLVDTGARLDSEADEFEFSVNSPYRWDGRYLKLRAAYQLLSWSSDEENIIDCFVQLLIKGGFLSTELRPRCYNNDGAKSYVSIFFRPPEFDHIIMLCPAEKRQALYNIIVKHGGDKQTIICHAGIFTAAAGGVRSLKAYIQSCRQDIFFDLLFTMQESLVFATFLNDTQTMSALLQLGTDPAVGLLQSHEEKYDKGTLLWNPMVIAAVAGSKEALMLLKEWSHPDAFLAFLEWVPVHEIVHQMNLSSSHVGSGTDLWHLDNFRRGLLYDTHVSLQSDSEVAAKIIGSRTTRFEILTWIRSNAEAHHLATKIDQDILKAAVSKVPGSILRVQVGSVRYHYCDVLLLDGLVDANLEYQESGMDLLQLSIRNHCSLEVVLFLISRGFKVHPRPVPETDAQSTLLHDALLSNSPDRCEIVHLLLDQGFDCKQMGTGITLLEASLMHCGSIHRRDSETPAYLDVFQRLLDEGAPVPPRPRRLMNHLVEAGAEDELILSVIDTVVEVQKQGWRSRTKDLTWLPLAHVIFRRRETLARELIRRGADVHVCALPNNIFCSTALQTACVSRRSLEFIKYLVVEKRVDVNEASVEAWDGRTALQLCTSLPVAEFLLDHGADLNALSGRFTNIVRHPMTIRFRRRALDFAAGFGHLDMLDYLLKAGGRSGYGGLEGAILLAKEEGHFTVLSVLLDWERKHRSQIIEEEAKWQREHPDAARLRPNTVCARKGSFFP